jgi:alkylhydroperoxidase family enzyme
LFDYLSKTTMRYVTAARRADANEIGEEVYRQINNDFFINGSLTSRSKVTPIFAATWMAGRETIIVDDQLDRVTKEAIAATLSSVNDCPYCGDMLVSLVHAGDRHDQASAIYDGRTDKITDPKMRELLSWVIAVASPGSKPQAELPFTDAEMPEVMGSIMAMADINAFSHVVMDGSPVNEPMGSSRLKSLALRAFGAELVPTQKQQVVPGLAIKLVPEAQLPIGYEWAVSNPRIAEAIARWIAAVDREAEKAVPTAVRELVISNIDAWDGDQMPMSRSWLERETESASGADRDFARFALIMVKARYQLDDSLTEAVLAHCPDDESFIRILAWCSNLSARALVSRINTQIKSTKALAA